MHKTDSVSENETDKILSDFEIQTDHRISARRLEIINKEERRKENLPNGGHAKSWLSGEPNKQNFYI